MIYGVLVINGWAIAFGTLRIDSLCISIPMLTVHDCLTFSLMMYISVDGHGQF